MSKPKLRDSTSRFWFNWGIWNVMKRFTAVLGWSVLFYLTSIIVGIMEVVAWYNIHGLSEWYLLVSHLMLMALILMFMPLSRDMISIVIKIFLLITSPVMLYIAIVICLSYPGGPFGIMLF